MAPRTRVAAFNCSLKGSGNKEKSSTDVLLQQVLDALAEHGVTGEIVRAVDLDIKPGVHARRRARRRLAGLLKRVLAADILVMGSPIWLGQPSSVAKRVLERMDAFLDDKDDKGRMKTYGKVALVAVVGNEDGAHHVGAELYRRSTTWASPGGERHDLLGRRSDGQQGIQGIQQAAQAGGRMDAAARLQRGASRPAAEEGRTIPASRAAAEVIRRPPARPAIAARFARLPSAL